MKIDTADGGCRRNRSWDQSSGSTYMAWIKQIDEAHATGRLADIYAAARQRAGGVARIITIMSQDASTCQAAMQFYVQLMKSRNALEPARREMLAAVVSNVNDCYY